jgi:outer membrane murein-binding lipoprotein Lpp
MKNNKKTMVLITLTITILFIITGCVSQREYDKINTHNEQLKTENEELKAELDELLNGSERLLSNMKLSYDEKDFEEAKNVYAILKEKHFDSEEFSEATLLYNEITNFEQEEEEKRKQEEEILKQERLQALEVLVKENDDVLGITWYYQPYFTHYNNRNLMSIYMGQKDSIVWLILKMSYQGDNWIFFEQAYLSYEGNTLEVVFDKYENKETENEGGGVWEWIQVPIDDSMIDFLEKFAQSTEAKMRLSGKYTETRTLSEDEKQGIIDILNGYYALKDGIQ